MSEKTEVEKKKLFKTAEHNANKLIILFGVFLLTITTIVMANDKGWITIDATILNTFKTITLILWAYFISAVFIRITQNRVHKLFDESVGTEQKILLSKFYTFFIYAIATAFVLWKLGVTLANITIFFGLVATGLAFALREVILPLFVWFILLTKKPFRIGDYIKIGEDEGLVGHIGTFFVFLESINTNINETIKIPNKIFLEKQIINYGSEKLPVVLKVPITATDLKECEEKIAEIKKNLLKVYPDYDINPRLLSEKEYMYLLFEFFVPIKEKKVTDIKHKIYEETYKLLKGPR